jgi:hypothetical protein
MDAISERITGKRNSKGASDRVGEVGDVDTRRAPSCERRDRDTCLLRTDRLVLCSCYVVLRGGDTDGLGAQNPPPGAR